VTTSRLSVGDWVQAGFEVIADEGLKALTIDRLCRRVGATKGSFYWHFADMSGYRAALIDAWGTLRDAERGHLEDQADLAPRERLLAMMTALVSPRHWMLERAMREWARSEPTVAAAVAQSDRRVLAAVRRAFTDAGFDTDEAEVRADATFAAGLGFLHLSGAQPNSRLVAGRERFLDIMLRR
jgi:AcrR family transcriptional regulator